MVVGKDTHTHIYLETYTANYHSIYSQYRIQTDFHYRFSYLGGAFLYSINRLDTQCSQYIQFHYKAYSCSSLFSSTHYIFSFLESNIEIRSMQYLGNAGFFLLSLVGCTGQTQDVIPQNSLCSSPGFVLKHAVHMQRTYHIVEVCKCIACSVFSIRLFVSLEFYLQISYVERFRFTYIARNNTH